MRRVAALIFPGLMAIPLLSHAQPPASAPYVGQRIHAVTLLVEGRPTAQPGLLDLLVTREGQSLSMGDVRESITHFLALGRFEEVVVDAEPSPDGGVDLRYRLEPLHRVTRVDFRGDLGVPAGTLRDWMTDRFSATPPVGRAADVATMLSETYRDYGYMTATVRAAPPIIEHDPDRAILVFDINAGPQARVATVSIEGTPLDSREELLARLGVTPGRPYQRADLRQRLTNYASRMRRAGYYQATTADRPAKISEDGTRADLILEIVPGPPVRVRYEGDPVPKEKLTELVPIEREGSVDEDLLEDTSRRLEQYLKQQGYFTATVTHERREQDGVLTIVFHISRGRLYHVAPGGVEISGRQTLPPDELKPLARLSEGGPFVSSRLDAIVAAIKDLYQRRGYANVEVTSDVNEVAPGLLKPVIVIKEGPRVLVREITIEGNHALRTDDLLRVIKSRPGEPFYAPAVRDDVEAIRSRYLNAGYASVQVSAAPTLLSGGAQADIPFQVQEGPQSIIDHILIVGNTRTSPSVIRRELQIRRGQPYSPEAVAESRRRLVALGLFRRVNIAPLPHGSPTNPDILVTVDEALRTTIGYGGGAEIDRLLQQTQVEGEAREKLEFAPRGFFEIGRRNLGGTNRSVNLYTRLSLRPSSDPNNPRNFGFAEYRIVGTYREPKAARGRIDLTGTAAVEQGKRTSFSFSRQGINLDATRRFSEVIRNSVRYSFGTTRTFDEQLDLQDQLTIDRLFPQVRLSAFSDAVSRDTRDDVIDPQGGTFLSADGTVAARAIGSQVGFTKIFLQGFFYRRLGHPHLVFAGGARLGVATLFERFAEEPDQNGNPVPIDNLPASERFFAGGDTTIRGFSLDSVGAPDTISPEGFPKGGNALVIFNGELRAPVWRDLGAAFFIDGGNVFLRATDLNLGELRGGVGFGLRYRSPIGPIRLDLGFKLDRRVIAGRLEPRTALHFSIGQAF